MDQSMKLQMNIRNNAEDLRNYVLDLDNWVDEMNKKEESLNSERLPNSNVPPPRNKVKRSKPTNENGQSEKPTKISAYDYSAWDKFDVDKACAEIDMENNIENNEEKEIINKSNEKSDEEVIIKNVDRTNSNLSLIDEAYFEKEMGNSFVKKEQWADAIKCYTNAINLNKKNAVFYANRSLCFIKLQNFKAAETDATTALQLDNKYIKAYQRRAFARQALGQHIEAKSDYEQILKLEPKNSLARLEIVKINARLNKENVTNKPVAKPTFNHKDIFKNEKKRPEIAKTAETESKKMDLNKSESVSKNLEIINSENKSKLIKSSDAKKKLNGKEKLDIFEKGDGDKNTQNESSTSLKNFKPLPDGCKIVHPVNIPPHKRSKKPLRKITITQIDENLDSSAERKISPTNLIDKREVTVFSKLNEVITTADDMLTFDVPKSAIQFQKSWIVVRKNPKEACSYLKKISGSQLAQIFENSLESDFFSELISFLASNDLKEETDMIYDYLLGLSKVKRFSSLVLFMSNADKANVKKCISQLENVKSKEKISELCRQYEL